MYDERYENESSFSWNWSMRGYAVGDPLGHTFIGPKESRVVVCRCANGRALRRWEQIAFTSAFTAAVHTLACSDNCAARFRLYRLLFLPIRSFRRNAIAHSGVDEPRDFRAYG